VKKTKKETAKKQTKKAGKKTGKKKKKKTPPYIVSLDRMHQRSSVVCVGVRFESLLNRIT
jgi:ribosomal protein S25